MGRLIGRSVGEYNGMSRELVKIRLRKREERLRIKKLQSVNRTKNNLIA